jgi:hypothetical protein
MPHTYTEPRLSSSKCRKGKSTWSVPHRRPKGFKLKEEKAAKKALARAAARRKKEVEEEAAKAKRAKAKARAAREREAK